MVSGDAKKAESPSLPGDKRPLISDEASAATAETELRKVLNPYTPLQNKLPNKK